MSKTTATGTIHPTVAEDAVGTAMANSDAWQEVTETDDEDEPVDASADYIHYDQKDHPGDGQAFTIEELESDRVAALVLADPENAYTVKQGVGEGAAERGTVILVIVERLVRESEAQGTTNQQRWLKDKLCEVCDDVFTYLTTNKGPYWCRKVVLRQPPIENPEKTQEFQGTRQTAAIAVYCGPASEGLGS